MWPVPYLVVIIPFYVTHCFFFIADQNQKEKTKEWRNIVFFYVLIYWKLKSKETKITWSERESIYLSINQSVRIEISIEFDQSTPKICGDLSFLQWQREQDRFCCWTRIIWSIWIWNWCFERCCRRFLWIFCGTTTVARGDWMTGIVGCWKRSIDRRFGVEARGKIRLLDVWGVLVPWWMVLIDERNRL